MTSLNWEQQTLSASPALNAAWNPVTYSDHNVIDLTTGLLNGTLMMTFANADELFGNLFEDVSALAATGGIGPFTQTSTFTGEPENSLASLGRSQAGARHPVREARRPWNPDCGGRRRARAGICCADTRRPARHSKAPGPVAPAFRMLRRIHHVGDLQSNRYRSATKTLTQKV